MKISEEEKVTWEEWSTEEKKLEAKRTHEEIVAEEKGAESKNEVDESNTEKELDITEEKQAIIEQQH